MRVPLVGRWRTNAVLLRLNLGQPLLDQYKLVQHDQKGIEIEPLPYSMGVEWTRCAELGPRIHAWQIVDDDQRLEVTPHTPGSPASESAGAIDSQRTRPLTHYPPRHRARTAARRGSR